jgi:hypothetical protein
LFQSKSISAHFVTLWAMCCEYNVFTTAFPHRQPISAKKPLLSLHGIVFQNIRLALNKHKEP